MTDPRAEAVLGVIAPNAGIGPARLQPETAHDGMWATSAICRRRTTRHMKPNGMSLVLEDGELAIWGSNAIVRDVAAGYCEGASWARNTGAPAQADTLSDWQQSVVGASMGPAFLGLIRSPPEKRDTAVIHVSIGKTEMAFDLLDEHPSKRTRAAGDAFAFADDALKPSTHRWQHMPVQRRPCPRLNRWKAVMGVRPAAGPALPTI